MSTVGPKEVLELLILPTSQRTAGKEIRRDVREYRLENIGPPLFRRKIDGMIMNVFVYSV